jgi:predicted DNA-binding protein with PD1-like motif
VSESLLAGISSQGIERVVHFRVNPGSDLLSAIEEAVRRENIKTGVFMSGLGALKKAVFRNLRWFPKEFPVKPEDRLYLIEERPMEMVSLVGWVATTHDGKPEVHAHFAASMVEGETVTTMGGHLTEGTITGIKVVVAIAVLKDGAAYAGFDEQTQTTDICY